MSRGNDEKKQKNRAGVGLTLLLCLGIKKYIVGLIIKSSSNGELMQRQKVYLSKLNMILVEVSAVPKEKKRS